MQLQKFVFLLFTLWWAGALWAQTPCNTPGQNPSTAFPVCGNAAFNQVSVNLCGGRRIPNPKCNSIPLDDRNPYYYKFTCFVSGTLQFVITPNDLDSDYDWQLFDVTNRNPDDIFADVSLTMASNWSGNSGLTGTSPNATNLNECENNTPKFSALPQLQAGRNYLLMVSHFSNTQSGYRLEFSGGTAVITDTTKLQMKELKAGCGGTEFYLKLNKPVKCNSIAPNGSDWEFFNANVPIASATGYGCNSAFETDSILIRAVGPLPSGTFALRSKRGTDANTLLDLCDQALPEGQTLVVNILPSQPVNIDSVKPVGCKPSDLDVVMEGDILCSSIAANGSDFVVTGPSAVAIAGAAPVACANGVARIIRLQLGAPIFVGGNYRVQLKNGTDGNTLLSACNVLSLADTVRSFRAFDTVSAKIDLTIRSSCVTDTVLFSNAGVGGVNSWLWTEDGIQIGTSPSTERIYWATGTRVVGVRVSNGSCTDSAFFLFSTTDTRVKASFDLPTFACPGDSIAFSDRSTGPISIWQWTFGNGNTSNLRNPGRQLYTNNGPMASIPVKLVVRHINGCSDSAIQRIQVPNNCFIAVPSGFTPNGDGLNDFLYPLNAWKAENLQFRVFNRYGQLIWETRNWTRKWDGRLNGVLSQTGTYVWTLQYFDPDRQRQVSLKGTTVLIR
jgi:gliding motility-associated-like protein